jgi:hypothetical protein
LAIFASSSTTRIDSPAIRSSTGVIGIIVTFLVR